MSAKRKSAVRSGDCSSAIKLMHDMAAELEMAFSSIGTGDFCIEIPATDARRLLRRYEHWRKRIASRQNSQINEPGSDNA